MAGEVRRSVPPVLRMEPLGRIFDLGQRPTHIFGMLAAALFLHGVAGARAATMSDALYQYAREVRMAVNERLASTYEIEVVKEPDPPPPPPPEAPKPEDPPPPPPPEAEKTPPPVQKETPTPAPPQAQAGAVLTQAPDPNEPVDLTNSMVSGNGTTYAGGVTSAHGGPTYSQHAQVVGTPGATGTVAAPAVDRSHPIKRTDDTECRNFPAEADRDQQQVRVRVTVGPDGKMTGMQVVQDPGEGFAREARVCVARFRFEPATDRDGHPIAATRDFNISFERQ